LSQINKSTTNMFTTLSIIYASLNISTSLSSFQKPHSQTYIHSYIKANLFRLNVRDCIICRKKWLIHHSGPIQRQLRFTSSSGTVLSAKILLSLQTRRLSHQENEFSLKSCRIACSLNEKQKQNVVISVIE